MLGKQALAADFLVHAWSLMSVVQISSEPCCSLSVDDGTEKHCFFLFLFKKCDCFNGKNPSKSHCYLEFRRIA